MGIQRVDLLVPWKPRHFVLPGDTLVDEMCIARLLNPDPTILVGYSPRDEKIVASTVVTSILKMGGSIPAPLIIPPDRRIK